MKQITKILFTALILAAPMYALNMKSAQSFVDYAKKVVKEVTPQELYQMIVKSEEEDYHFYLVDIREPDQIGHGEIFHMDQIRITRGYLEFMIENKIPDKNANIVVYCCTGKRGILAAKTLKDMGYKNVVSLKGGIRNWVESGLPLDTVYGEMVYKCK